MPFIIYPQADNKLAVIIPTGDVQDCIKDVPANTEYAIVDDLGDLDNEYFNAFVYHNLGLRCDIDKAKQIHLNKFLEARKPLLESLDVQYMRALETENSVKAAEIAVKKQELRDVTKTDLPDTLPELKAVWPDILNP
jgi:hypothetical protein